MRAYIFSNRTFVFLVIYLALFFATCNNALFWDTIQFASLHPNWYYTTNFTELWLPKKIDSGHPMTFGLYIAGCWKLFGRNLFVTHLAMLPFILLLVAQAGKIGKLLFPIDKKWAFIATAFVLTEAVLVSQSTLASPDVVLMAFFLLGLNAVIEDRKWLLVLAIIGLAAISTRGSITAFSIYFFNVAYTWPGWISAKKLFQHLLKKMLPFIPGGLLAITYMLTHRYIGGWKGFEGTEWEHGFDIMSAPVVLKNFVILVWRLSDFGKVLGNACFVFLVIYLIKRKSNRPSATQRGLISFCFIFLLIGVLPLCFFQGLLGARYLLPFTTAFVLLLCLLLYQSGLKYKSSLAAIIILAQLAGSFMYYPKGLSTAWDSTLAHLPYFGLREEFKDFIKVNNIKYEEVASQFPITGSERKIDLLVDTAEIKNALDGRSKYVLYSNVCNSLHDSLDAYYRDMEVLKHEKRGALEMILFQQK